MTVELECIPCMYLGMIEFSAIFITSIVTSSVVAKKINIETMKKHGKPYHVLTQGLCLWGIGGVTPLVGNLITFTPRLHCALCFLECHADFDFNQYLIFNDCYFYFQKRFLTLHQICITSENNPAKVFFNYLTLFG